MERKTRYSIEQREQIVQETKEAGNIRAVAEKHGLNVHTIYGWVKAAKNKEKNQDRNRGASTDGSLFKT